jgi:hypothetical protein
MEQSPYKRSVKTRPPLPVMEMTGSFSIVNGRLVRDKSPPPPPPSQPSNHVPVFKDEPAIIEESSPLALFTEDCIFPIIEDDDMLTCSSDDTLSLYTDSDVSSFHSTSSSSNLIKDVQLQYWRTLAPQVATWLRDMPVEIAAHGTSGDRIQTFIENIQEMSKVYASIQSIKEYLAEIKHTIHTETDVRHALMQTPPHIQHVDIATTELLVTLQTRGFEYFMSKL